MEASPKSGESVSSPNPEAGTFRSRSEAIRQALRVRWRWVRKVGSAGVRELSQKIDHQAVIADVQADGVLTGRYVFMVVMACAIAILGLLLSSPAVVIGAMLISPLMGPIMLLGFSLCILDYEAMRKALVGVGAGVMGALAISIVIVMFSPLREATPEILARTRPNLFDLLVAIFSGLAGGYSVIHRRGATIVGVAIATALMPPLAVVGFGIATGSGVIAGGAFFLFMTNLLAIALSVTGLAWLHGFATQHSKKAVRWQTILVVIVFGGLSLPLGFALRDIAYEAQVQNVVRKDALLPFAGQEAEISGLTVTFPRDEPIHIDQTVLTRGHVAGAEVVLKKHYEDVLKSEVRLNLNQVLVAEDKPLDAKAMLQLAQQSMAPLQRQVEDLAGQERIRVSLRDGLPFPTLAIEVDQTSQAIRIAAAPSATMTVSQYREMEETLAARHPGYSVRITPAQMDLPLVIFDDGSQLSSAGEAAIEDIAWALERWGVTAVVVEGNASLGGSRSVNRALALRRAEAVCEKLGAKGIATAAVSAFGASGQAARERELGKIVFHSAKVVPGQQADTP